MTTKQAVKLAVEAMQKECKRLAFDANLHERIGLDAPEAVRAYKARERYRAAIATIEALAK